MSWLAEGRDLLKTLRELIKCIRYIKVCFNKIKEILDFNVPSNLQPIWTYFGSTVRKMQSLFGHTITYIEPTKMPLWLTSTGYIFKICVPPEVLKMHSLALSVLRFLCKSFSKLLKFTLRSTLLWGQFMFNTHYSYSLWKVIFKKKSLGRVWVLKLVYRSKIPWICHSTDLSATIHIILEEHREGMLDSNKTINNHQVWKEE